MALDTTFGTSRKGWTLTNNGYTSKSHAIDSNNNIFITGVTLIDAPGGKLFISKYSSSGVLDTTFGKDGYVIGDYYSGKYSIGVSIVLDKSGNILVTGTTLYDNDTGRLLITRYSSSGVLDSTFGGGKGWVTYEYPDHPEYNTSGSSMALDSNGRIVVCGDVNNSIGEGSPILFLVARYNTDGTLDKSFGGDGKGWANITDTSFNTRFTPESLVIDANTGYITVGGLFAATDKGGILVRLTNDGILDNNFGGGKGYVIVEATDYVNIILDNQGRTLLNTLEAKLINNVPTFVFDVFRYNKNGTLDTTFGSNGRTNVNFFNKNTFNSYLTLDSNNRIIVTGGISSELIFSFPKLFMARFTSNGRTDTTFGDSGLGYIVFTDIPLSTGSFVSLDNNGRIIVSGSGALSRTESADNGVLILRYLDTTTTTTTEPICLPAGTPILTDQGLVAIEKIDTKKHTINNKPVIAITKTVTPEKHLVCFEANSMGINCPSVRTIMTPGHEVLYKGKLVQAKHFLGRVEGVHTVPYNGKDILYNVLQEQHGLMRVNNMILETLHPENKVAKQILGKI